MHAHYGLEHTEAGANSNVRKRERMATSWKVFYAVPEISDLVLFTEESYPVVLRKDRP